MNQSSTVRTLALCLISVAAPGFGQATPHPAPPAASNFAGCVQRSATDKKTVVISSESVCAALTGDFSADKLVGHEVDLKGILTERTAAIPASIHVVSINSVQKSCSNTCSLQPPGTRGLHGGEKPGKEGGTPGATPTTPPQ